MGAVFRATDLHTGRELALKRVHLSEDAVRNTRCTELFHQEFRTLVQLAHPHVVAVYDFGIDESGAYYTMELIEGADLHTLAPVPWAEACGLMRDVWSALSLLHARRLLHRDISPRNLRRNDQGQVKLIDFGGMAPMGPCRTIVGTPPVVAPEALLQQSLDARADLFAIGATFTTYSPADTRTQRAPSSSYLVPGRAARYRPQNSRQGFRPSSIAWC